MKLCVSSLFASLSLLATSAHATTWIVDDTSGPGVDFNSISAGMSIAASGDVFIVRAGNYGGFTLATSAVVLGETGAFVVGDIHIANNAPLGHAALVGLTVQAVYVDASSGGVLLEDVVARPGAYALGQVALVTIQSASDVRLRNVDVDGIDRGIAGLAITSSRVEVAGCRFVGGGGRSHHVVNFSAAPEKGGDGIVVNSGSDLHVSRTDARGGSGGNLPAVNVCGCLIAANGGSGIRVGASANMLLTGTSASLVKGGTAGLGFDCPYDGLPGNGIVIHANGAARLSGIAVAGEAPRSACGGSPVLSIIGPHNIPSPADPTLSVSGPLTPGSLATYMVTGQPGATAKLDFGRVLAIADVAFVVEDRLTISIRSFSLGVIPPSGQVSLTIILPSYLPRGFLANAQAETSSIAVGISLSPSAPITLR
ncbi:MAG: hypothetical protein SGI72_10860 [Planctomycetota bacterium]|nr:hypothetical protein [Planctomycetota bacterium]